MFVRDFFIEGARADIAKIMSLDPMFQAIHTFQLPNGAPAAGGNPLGGPPGPPPYTFATVYASKNVSRYIHSVDVLIPRLFCKPLSKMTEAFHLV